MYAIARSNGFTDRESDPAVVGAFIKERTAYLIDLNSNSGKGGSSPVVPQVRNVIFLPMQVPKTNDDDDTEDNDDEINVPAEPAAKGSISVPQWSASARPLRTHYMMFHIQRCFMVSPNASSRLLHWGD